jgi:putative transposase
LDRIVELRGCRPAMVVSDNGTELTSHAILRWQEERAVLWHYIAPGKPQRTGPGKALTAGSGMNA